MGERFTPVQHDNDTVCYKTSQQTYLLVHDSTLRGTAIYMDSRTKLIEQLLRPERSLGTTSPPPKSLFDCNATGNWDEKWPLERKAYCCQHFKRGCPTIPSHRILEQKISDSHERQGHQQLQQALSFRSRFFFQPACTIGASAVCILLIGICFFVRVSRSSERSGKTYMACDDMLNNGDQGRLQSESGQSRLT